MSRLKHLTSILGCLCFAACGQSATLGQAAAQQTSEIVGGTRTTGWPAVGVLVNFVPNNSDNGALCTATLIDNNRLLTAAHCVLALSSNGALLPAIANPSDVVFYLGSSINRTIDVTKVYNVESIFLAGANFPFQQFIKNAQQGIYNFDDMAVVHLARSPSVTPMRMATAPISPDDLGATLTLVGYGTTGKYDGNTAGDKRVTQVPLNAFNDVFIEAGTTQKGTCSGDSGGPALLNNIVVAVTQAGQTDSSGRCVGHDIFTRTDVWSAFIQNN